MSEVFFLAGYSVYFSTLDKEHGIHVHVASGSKRDFARFVLQSDGTVLLAHNHGHLPTKHIKLIEAAIRQNFGEIVDDWRRLFGNDVHFDK